MFVSIEHAEHVRQHGILQFINLYARLKDRQGDVLKWGDEIEYMIVRFDHENKKAQVSLRADEILQQLNEEEAKNPDGEFGKYGLRNIWILGENSFYRSEIPVETRICGLYGNNLSLLKNSLN